MKNIIKILKQNYELDKKAFTITTVFIAIFVIVLLIIGNDIFMKIAFTFLGLSHFLMMNATQRQLFYDKKISDLLNIKNINMATFEAKTNLTKYEYGYDDKKQFYRFYIPIKEKKKIIDIVEEL